MTKANADITVAEFFTQEVKRSGMSPRELADRLGPTRPDIIKAIMKGKIEIPYPLILPAAVALEINPMMFFFFALAEYRPDISQTFHDIFELTQKKVKAKRK